MFATSSHLPNSNNVLPDSIHHAGGPPFPQMSPPQSAPRTAPSIPKVPIVVVGIPSVSIQNNSLIVGSTQSNSTRSYTPLKVLGDGSFGTVWLCDWHGTLPPNTPLSPMQCGAGARPEWAGKRLVAVKRMKKKWEGGWDECQKLKELESLRSIPFHPNIIPLYDFFLLPASKELYFVFESMEGNLYHLIKARKGRPLAGGLVSSIFHQIVCGLEHIHSSGYFHRDMKPENVLVTTIGLHDYVSLLPSSSNTQRERDVVAIIKLADFGLARETKSKPPYTEYVSTRWYRAPEVLLYSRDYSNPVDMWALGTIMAELVNLRPLFPGSDQIDQVARICEILGDPSDEYGLDSEHQPVGGGSWARGIKMARAIGFQFPKIQPKDIRSLFERTVPPALICCIRDLLKYDPDRRLTSRQCLEHVYLLETLSRDKIPMPAEMQASNPSMASLNRILAHSFPPTSYVPVSYVHTSESNPSFHSVSSSHRTPCCAEDSQIDKRGELDHKQCEQQLQYSFPGWKSLQTISNYHPIHDSLQINHPSSKLGNGSLQDYSSGSNGRIDTSSAVVSGQPPHGSKLVKLGSLSFGKKHAKWGLGMFGGDKSQLPTLEEVPGPPRSLPSLKRPQSSSTDDKSGRDLSPIREHPLRTDNDLRKLNKKEAERVQREAEKQRRKLAEKMHRDQARAVMQKRNQMIQKTAGNDIEWAGGNEQRLDFSETSTKGKSSSAGSIRQNLGINKNSTPFITVDAAIGRFVSPDEIVAGNRDRRNERFSKARRREYDSMSSSDVHSLECLSAMSFASVDSDPGPTRLRHRSSLLGINRMSSLSSLRTSDFAPSGRSSNSFSLEGQLVHDFRIQASVNVSHAAGSVSPPPMQLLSLSPTLSPSLSPSPPWIQVQQTTDRQTQSPPYINIPGTFMFDRNFTQYYGHPPHKGKTPDSAKSRVNPIFEVPPLRPHTGDSMLSHKALPPFSQLDAIAGREYPPLSPASLVTTPSEGPF